MNSVKFTDGIETNKTNWPLHDPKHSNTSLTITRLGVWLSVVEPAIDNIGRYQMYKVNNPKNNFLKYEYDDDKEKSYMSMKSLASVSDRALPTANDVIINWADFAKNDSQYADESMECWSGHYEQFGRLMYHMIDVTLRKEDYLKAKRFTKKQLDFFPELSTVQFLAEGWDGTDDRPYYRRYFDILGHKDFRGKIAAVVECPENAYIRYIITLLARDLDSAIISRDAGKAEYLHCE